MRIPRGEQTRRIGNASKSEGDLLRAAVIGAYWKSVVRVKPHRTATHHGGKGAWMVARRIRLTSSTSD
jgi:hypothetical protein